MSDTEKRSSLQFLGDIGAGAGGNGDTQIKQTDTAMFPGAEDPLLALIMKSRGNPALARPGSWLLAEAVIDGEIGLTNLGLGKNATVPTVYTALTYANTISSNGDGRKEMVEVLSAVNRRVFGRVRGMFGRNNGYEGGGF